MFTAALLWACLACTSDSLRALVFSQDTQESVRDEAVSTVLRPQSSFNWSQESGTKRGEALNPLEALAMILTEFNPAASRQATSGSRSLALSHKKAVGVASRAHRIAQAPRLQGVDVATLDVTSTAAPNITEPTVRVWPEGCKSCETDYMERTQEAQNADLERRRELRTNNMSGLLDEVFEYAMRMNETQRQILMLKTDQELRSYMFNSSTGPTPLMERVFNTTMARVPYEVASFICGMDQGMLLRTLVSLARPRRCLDVGSFTGYSSSSILEGLPDNAMLTCLDIDPDYTNLAEQQLADRKNVEFVVGPAIDAMHRFEQEGQQFDFICLDADKPMHGEYYNSSLRLLRPGGVLVMFGMILFATPEDQEAMMTLHEKLPNDTRVATAQLPLGCGMQLMVKSEGVSPELTDADKMEHKRWQLESELAAIDRYVSALDKPLQSTN